MDNNGSGGTSEYYNANQTNRTGTATSDNHYRLIKPVMKVLGELECGGEAIGNADRRGWYRNRETNLPRDLKSDNVDGIGRGYLLASDYNHIWPVVDRTLYATINYAESGAHGFCGYRWTDDGREWLDDENPLPGYSDLIGYAPFADIDLADEIKHRRPDGDIPQGDIEIALGKYIDQFANLVGSRDAVFALDSVGGAYVFVAPAVTAPIASEFNREQRGQIFEELTKRVNKWLNDVGEEVTRAVETVDGIFEPDLANNKNRLYKTPLSIHSSLDGVVTPITTEDPKYVYTPFKCINQDLVEEATEWAKEFTDERYRDCVDGLIASLWPEYDGYWEKRLDSWLKDEFSQQNDRESNSNNDQQSHPRRDRKLDNNNNTDTTGRHSSTFDAVDAIDTREVVRELADEWDTAPGRNPPRFNPGYRKSESGTSCFTDGEKIVDLNDPNRGIGVVSYVAREYGIVGTKATAQGEDWWEAVDQLRNLGYDIPKCDITNDKSTNSEPFAPIPFTTLTGLSEDELKRYAQRRGLEWPSSEELSEQIGEAICRVMEGEEKTVIRAPTGSDKTGQAVGTVWRAVDEKVTGGRPVIMFCGTTDARDEALNRAETAGLDVGVRRDRYEACSACRGEFDPGGKYVDADDSDKTDPYLIKGTHLSEWIEHKCEHRGLPISFVHSKAEEILKSKGRDMPCARGESRCKVNSQWEDLMKEIRVRCAIADHTVDDCNECGTKLDRCDDVGTKGHSVNDCPNCTELKIRCECHDPDHRVDNCDDCHSEQEPKYDLVIATDPFAYVPSLTANTNIIQDEQPDYVEEFGIEDADESKVTARVRSIVTAFLRDANIPNTPETFEAFVELARETAQYADYWNEHASPETRPSDNLVDKWEAVHRVFEHSPSRDWYLNHPDAHTLAPALVRAIWNALREGFDQNGRASSTVGHTPPRLDNEAGDMDGWNRTYVTVVIDDENTIRTVRNAPDFSTARSVVGLDAWPTPGLWQLNVHPVMTVNRVLGRDAERLWRRIERGQTVVRIGDADRPIGDNGTYYNERHARTVIERLRNAAGADFRAIGTGLAIENDLKKLLIDAGAEPDAVDTLHYNEEKSRNSETFAKSLVGLVYQCIDPGDDYVKDLLAELGLRACPERADPDDGREDPSTAYCSACEGDGCRSCDDSGLKRARGRGFIGPNADQAAQLLASVREQHVAQMTGRFGRDLDDGEYNITFVAAATPDDLIDYQLPDVQYLGDKQQAVYEALDDLGPTTTRAVADAADCSKKHARESLSDLEDARLVARRAGAGNYGADIWQPERGADDLAVAAGAVLDAGQAKLSDFATSAVRNPSTWEVAIEYIHAPPRPADGPP